MDSLVKANYLKWMSLADRRVEKWLMMSSPLPTVVWSIVYITIVLIGLRGHLSFPRCQFRLLLVVQNTAMIVINAYVCTSLLILTKKANYGYICQPVNYSDDPVEVQIAASIWWYYISKLLEFMDTFLFILKGNLRQVTFLHVYHHVSMFCFWFIGANLRVHQMLRWSTETYVYATINSGVHVIMYGYYLASVLSPGSLRRWKKSITGIQLIQFAIVAIVSVYGLYIDCPMPRWMGYVMVVYMMGFVVLFSNFWIKEYNTKNTNVEKKKNE